MLGELNLWMTYYKIHRVFNIVKWQKGLVKSNFLTCTGLRQSVPPHLCTKMPCPKTVFDLENDR